MKYLFIFLAILFVAAPVFAFAQTTGINLNLQYPIFGDIDINTEQNPNAIVGWLYYFIVGISALAAFAMIVWGGIQWLTSGAIPSQASAARDKLKSALLGLLLIMASFLIIQIINPQLTILEQPTNPDALGENPTLDALVGSGGAVGCGESATVDLKARDKDTAPCSGIDTSITFDTIDPSGPTNQIPSGRISLDWTSPAGTDSCVTSGAVGNEFLQAIRPASGSWTSDPGAINALPGSYTYSITCTNTAGVPVGSDTIILNVI